MSDRVRRRALATRYPRSLLILPIPALLLVACGPIPALGADSLGVAGQISIGGRYTQESDGFFDHNAPWTLSGDSRMTARYGAASLAGSFDPPQPCPYAGQPDRGYTFELGLGSSRIRYGDLTADFTANTAVPGRIAGMEVRHGFGRWGEARVLSGVSRRAAAGQEYLVGSNRQDFLGVRIAGRPARSLQLGATLVRMRDRTGAAGAATTFFSPAAEDNLVAGFDVSAWFLRRRGRLTAEIVESLYTPDQRVSRSGTPLAGAAPLPSRLATAAGRAGLFSPTDSTRAGEFLAVRLVVPIRSSQISADYWRSSAGFHSLARPTQPARSQRLRLNHRSRWLGGRLDHLLSGDCQWVGAVSARPVRWRKATFSSNLSWQSGTGRFTFTLRQNDRHDQPESGAGTAWCEASNLSRSANLTAARGTALWSRALEVSASASVSSQSARSRTVSGSRRYGLQFGLGSAPDDENRLEIQPGWWMADPKAGPGQQGIDLRVARARPFGARWTVEGHAALSGSWSEGRRISSGWTLGGEVHWKLSSASETAWLWQSDTRRYDPADGYAFESTWVELRLIRRF